MNELALQSTASGGLRELALFAGAGGGILGGKLLGWRTVCAVEINDYCRRVLMQRQCDGILEPFPIWDDVRTFNGRPWRGIVDVVSGGFPCKGISAIGDRSGLEHVESGLWREQARIIGQVLPRFVLVENSPELLTNGGIRVVGDLAQMGYGGEWGVMGARHAGADHERDRIWILADAALQSWIHQSDARKAQKRLFDHGSPWKASTWDASQDRVCRMDDGIPYRLDRFTAVGNAQVPAVVRLAWETLAPMNQPEKRGLSDS